MRVFALLLALSLLVTARAADPPAKPIAPAEASKKVDEKVTVEMEVKSTGGKEVAFLNSESDFKDAKNFTVFIPEAALEKFKKAKIEDPKTFYKGKTVRVSGTVEKLDGNVLTVKPPSGANLAVTLTGNYQVVGVVKATVADIKPGSYIGSGAMPQADGTQKATYAAWRMQIYLPVTRESGGKALEVWGCVRPARYAALGTGVPQRVRVQLRPRYGGSEKAAQVERLR